MTRPALVYVHGLWHRGWESFLLRRRLAPDFEFHGYHYASVRTPMPEVCEGLRRFVAQIDAPTVHFLGHSLGGIVIHRFLKESAPPKPGRVVLLGSPMAGSAVGASAARFAVMRPILGRCILEELLPNPPRQWTDPRPLGLIAGTCPLGQGQFFTRFGEPNDGVVALSETLVPGAAAQMSVPATHLGLLFSARVARNVASFLKDGRFLRA